LLGDFLLVQLHTGAFGSLVKDGIIDAEIRPRNWKDWLDNKLNPD
jgi:hypothetical protein